MNPQVKYSFEIGYCESITVSIRIVADYGHHSCQVTENMMWAITLEFNTSRLLFLYIVVVRT
ncbi:MAG: hypothetical protein QNK20_14150 [Aureibaculum sp.]|nr:hypothetical protein [Aureibaculum sp.]